MEPGDVLRVPYLFPDKDRLHEHQDPKLKWLVTLRCDGDEPDVTFLIASTLRPGMGDRRFEVIVHPPEGGFVADSVVDARWPNTLPRAWFESAEEMGKLDPATMEQVGKALVYGLGLHEIARRAKK